jgi:prophage DNA circulation protein
VSFAEILFEATYAGIHLDVVNVSDDEGRSVPQHEHPHVNGADTEDLGGRPRTTQLSLVFFPASEDDTDFFDRYTLLRAVKEQNEVEEFVHPFDGGWDARITGWSVRSDADAGAIFVDMTVVEHRRAQAIFAAGPGTPLLSGLEEVQASAADVDAELAAAGMPATAVTADCVATVARWSEGGATTRQVTLEVAALSNSISALTDSLELASNPTGWPVVRALTMLNYNVRRAAGTFLARTPRLIEVTVGAASPLLVIAGQIYGASQAQARYEQMMGLNSVRNPARVEAGTRLKAQAPRSRDRQRQPG